MTENIAESEGLRDKLKKKRVPVDNINRFLAYIAGEKTKERGKDKQPVTRNTDDQLYTMFIKFWNLGLVIDGVNVVITGRGMALVTYHGYKNKVKQVYPDAVFDVQLVREGDTFRVGKDSGKVTYTHEFGDPFTEKPIMGAYCVIKFGGNDYFEALNAKDYNEMKNASKNPSTWNKWESEFWLKSVIKRACKRHFNDITIDIDRIDNESYGLKDDFESSVKASNDKKASIIAAAKQNDNNPPS